jgi:hypothetical protein
LQKDRKQSTVARDPVEKTVAECGSTARVHYALSRHPEGLSIQDMAEITGLKKSTVYVKGVRELFNCQMLEEVRGPKRRVYRLISRADISAQGHDEVKDLKSSQKK